MASCQGDDDIELLNLPGLMNDPQTENNGINMPWPAIKLTYNLENEQNYLTGLSEAILWPGLCFPSLHITL